MALLTKMKIRIDLLAENNETVFSGKPDQLTFPEKLIKELSIEYFNDPNPCYIHQGAVTNTILLKLKTFFAVDGVWQAEDLPENIHQYLSAYSFSRVRISR